MTQNVKLAILTNRQTFIGEVRMSLRERLSDDLKTAMKSRDQLRVDVIRMIKATVLNKEVEIKKDLDDAEMSRVMTALIKQRKESVEQFEKGKRDDLADKERREILIIEGYLPNPVSVEEINTIIDAVLQDAAGASPKDMGLIMKTVMARLAGQTVDGKYVSERVRARLQS